MSSLYIDGKKIIETSTTVGTATDKVPICKAVNDLYVVEVKSTPSYTVAANSSKEVTMSVAKNGYTPIMAAPRGLSTAGWSWVACELNGNNITVVWNSLDYSVAVTGAANFYVLYKKNS